jgi:YVTN family beta-propeller protein
VIDGATDSVIATVMVGFDPWALCYDLQKNKVYCANNGSNDVTVIDGVTNQVVITLEVGSEPIALCHNPQYDRTYVVNYSGSSISVLRDSGGVGIEENPKPQASASGRKLPTIVRGVLFLSAKGEGRMANSELLDVSGRKVFDLRPCANDVSRLAPGVYFCRQTAGSASSAEPSAVSRRPSAVTKVIITK